MLFRSGPLAAQLAIYLGFVHYGLVGATLVGGAFVLPSFIMVVALGWAYQAYGGLPWMQAAFYGVGASVIGIITLSAYKLTHKTLGKDWLLWAIFLVSAAVTVIMENEIVLLFLAAGVLVWLVKAPPRFQRPASSVAAAVALPLAAIPLDPSEFNSRLWQIAYFFTKAGAFVFGSGLAIVPFLYGGVVKEYGWLNDQQFVDAVAVAMITPGPVVITVGFIGYLVAGFWGAVIAALATFLPCYLFTVIPAPYFKKHGKRPGLIAFVDGVTAAAVGAIAGAVIVLGRRTLLDDGQRHRPRRGGAAFAPASGSAGGGDRLRRSWAAVAAAQALRRQQRHLPAQPQRRTQPQWRRRRRGTGPAAWGRGAGGGTADRPAAAALGPPLGVPGDCRQIGRAHV